MHNSTHDSNNGNAQTTRNNANHGTDTHNEEIAWRVSATLSKPSALTPLILLMGFIGASLRYLLEAAFPAGGGFPWATLMVNIFGCFVLEIINQYVGRRLHLPTPLVKSLGVGLIGAFTTIAAFSAECVTFLNAGRYGLAALYIGTTMLTTFLSALAGRKASQYLSYRRLQRLRRLHAKRLHARAAKSESEQSIGTGTVANAYSRQVGTPIGAPVDARSETLDPGNKQNGRSAATSTAVGQANNTDGGDAQ